MCPNPREYLLPHRCQRVELPGRQDSLRNLDPQHLHVARLSLAVRAPNQPERTPLVRRQLAALELFERRHELVDIGLAGKGQPRPAKRSGIVNGRHG